MSDRLPTEDLADLYENAPCGYVSVSRDARIIQVNHRLADWLAHDQEALVGRPFQELLSFGARIAFETHLAPLLRIQGHVDEIALDLVRSDGTKIPVIANAVEKREADRHVLTRLTLFKAVDRRTYERGLVAAQKEAEAAVEAEHHTSVLREQFIAVLGHDLKNPLAALAAGVRLLGDREHLSDRGRVVLKEMNASVARASALVGNVLDFARGRLGGGVTLDRQNVDLVPVLEQVVAEVRAFAPDRAILSDFELPQPINCDPGRIAQLMSNLVSNAVTHGAPGVPIEVEACVDDGFFRLSVSNGGVPISEAARKNLFEPFFRESVRRSQQGLGLGLFIVSEIAKAHGGTMNAVSSEEITRFTFSMPLVQAATP